jgi:hypothetical protein
MLVATWVLAASTLVLAISGPIALLTWLNVRRADRERRERERASEAQQRMIDEARKEFVSKNTLIGSIVLAAIAAVIGLASWSEFKESVIRRHGSS